MKSAPKIAINARLADPSKLGGVGTLILGMARGLSQLSDGEETYHFLVPRGRGDWLAPYLAGPCRLLEGPPLPPPPARRRWRRVPGLAYVWHHWLPEWGLRADRLPRSDGTIEAAGIDLIHFLGQSAFLTDVPSVYHPHDLQHVHLPQFFTPRQIRWRELIYRTYGDRARLVACASSWVQRDLMAHFGWDAHKVQVVPMAPIIDEIAPPTPADIAVTRRALNLPAAFVFYPAQTWPHKNHLGLLRAIAVLRDRGLEVAAVCSGFQTEHMQTIQAEIRRLRLEKAVFFVGFVDPTQLRALYHECRAVVVPTRFEAASFPIWEAFASGAAVACSTVTSLPDQVADAALLFDPDDVAGMVAAIEKLWTDDGLRATLIERGRRRIGRLTWPETARHFRAHYRRLLGQPLDDDDRARLTADAFI